MPFLFSRIAPSQDFVHGLFSAARESPPSSVVGLHGSSDRRDREMLQVREWM